MAINVRSRDRSKQRVDHADRSAPGHLNRQRPARLLWNRATSLSGGRGVDRGDDRPFDAALRTFEGSPRPEVRGTRPELLGQRDRSLGHSPAGWPGRHHCGDDGSRRSKHGMKTEPQPRGARHERAC